MVWVQRAYLSCMRHILLHFFGSHRTVFVWGCLIMLTHSKLSNSKKMAWLFEFNKLPLQLCSCMRYTLLCVLLSINQFLAATKQLYEWFSSSVCLSVTPFWLCSHHGIIMKFSGVITNGQGKVHAKGQGQRSRSQRSQPNLTVSRL